MNLLSRPVVSSLRREFWPMLRLATPVVVAELGWTAMATVDTLMVGRISAEAIGAVSLGSAIFLGVTIFGMGLLLGLDTLISQAYGSGRLRDCHRSLIHGIYAALMLALPLTAILLLVMRALPELGINPDVLELTLPYLRPVTWSLLPLLLYAASRRYLQATGHESSVMVVLVTANVVNALTNWGLVFGKWGLPELGVVGAGWATFVSRTFMAIVLLGAIALFEWRNPRGLFQTPLGIEWSRVRELFALGLPAAFHITLEMGLFSVATALAARLDPASLAAHQIALSVAATTFMVPLGVSSAGAVRVGHAVGARDRDGVVHGGWMAIVFGVSFMGLAAATLFLFPKQIIGLFTTDADVFAVGVSLLYVAAFFQLLPPTFRRPRVSSASSAPTSKSFSWTRIMALAAGHRRKEGNLGGTGDGVAGLGVILVDGAADNSQIGQRLVVSGRA